MSTPNDYNISPEQVIEYRNKLELAKAQGATARKIQFYQNIYDEKVKIWKQTFPDAEIPE